MNIKRLLFVFAMAMLAFVMPALAQDKVVTGKVTDSKDGTPLIGASVLVKGTTIGMSTDATGSFSFKVPASATTLVISSVSYTAKEVAIGTGNLSVQLDQANAALNEVVVIGYGSARKKDLTGSVVSISAKEFNKGAITTPEQLISGKAAGVQITSNGGAPGAGSTIRIRGGASLNASNDPLIVIDGVPLSNNGISGQANPLSLINPNDIENFTILKDASATAIYGARGSNGVILITTKKGAKGVPKFTFSSQLAIQTPTKQVDVMSADQFKALVNKNGNAAQIALLGTANTNWQDQIYQTAIGTDNNFGVSGAIKNIPYRVSLGYLNQDGILKSGNLERTSLAINLSPKFFNDHLSVNLSVLGTSSKSKFANEGAIGAAVTFDPTKPVTSGNNRFGGYWEWLDPTSISGLKGLSPKNPLGILLQNDNRSKVQRSVGSAQIDYKLHFLPDLHVKMNASYDISHSEGTVKVTDSAASSYKRFQDAANVYKSGVSNNYKQDVSNTFLQLYLNYVKNIKSIDSRLDIMGGYEYNNYLTTNFNYADYSSDGTKRPNSDPNFAFDKPENTILSWFGRMNFTIQNKYILTATFRRDGSSRFSPSNRWGNFPSGAFAWKMKEEDFLKDVDVISDMKFRIGYGITGQQDGIGNYDYITNYFKSETTAQYQFGNTFYQMYRPAGYYANRKWEQTASFNVALDYGLFNNSVTGSIEYYNRKTTDLLNLITQPAGTNFSNQIVANVGDMENKGVEFSLNATPVRTKNLVWDFGFNVTYNQNTITKLTISEDPNYPGNIYGGISGGTGNSILINSVGYPRGSFYAYQQVYDKAGNPIDNLFSDRNRDGLVSDKDLYRYKNPDPKVFFGLNSNITYNKWNAGFVMRAHLDNYLYNNVASSTGTIRNVLNPLNFLSNGSTDVLATNFSGNGSQYYLSDYYIQNASFLRMDNIYVGYNFGKIFHDKANLRLGANVQNVFVITKYKGTDPEINGGIDNNFYPRPRTYALSLNLDF